MLKKKTALVITFHTTTEAMAMERFCMKRGLPGRLIPVPREITSGCGLAWKAAPEDKTPLADQMWEAGLRWEQMHTIQI